MTVYGYWRCSTDLQDQERQIVALKKMQCESIYGDHITGKSNFSERPELMKLLDLLKSGDILVISELSRLSRSFLGMVNEISKLLERGIHIKTLDKRLDTTTMDKSVVKLIVGIMGYCSEQELSQIRSRCSEGREISKLRGVKFGRKLTYTQFQVDEIMKKRSEGQGYGTISKSLGMSRSMVQRIVNNSLQTV